MKLYLDIGDDTTLHIEVSHLAKEIVSAVEEDIS